MQGIHETPDEARAYLRHEAGDSYNGERVDAFLAHGPEAVDFFTANTEVQFDMPLVFPTITRKPPAESRADARWWRAPTTAASWARTSRTWRPRCPS